MTTSPEQKFLGALDTLGVPIWVAVPAAGEFHRPVGWQQLGPADNRARASAYRPGSALCGNMGGSVAVVDCDVRNDADPAAVRALLDRLGVRVYADVDTPGGGKHYYLAGHPDLPTVHAQKDRPGFTGYPGVEVLSFGTNVFLPGTLRAKYGGRGYSIMADDLADLADGDPGSGEAFAAWAAEHRSVTPATAARATGPAWTGGTPDTRQTAYLAAAVDRQCAAVATMQPDTGRNHALYTAALKLGSYVAGAGLDESTVTEQLTDAATRCGLTRDDGPASVAASIRSGLRNGCTQPRAIPDPPAVTVLEERATADLATGEVHPAAAVPPAPPRRRLTLTRASSVRMRPARWFWATGDGQGRIPEGQFIISAGRAGIGKSQHAAWLTAHATRGTLPGSRYGTPVDVIYAATEDSWEMTIAPRLTAAGADLDRVWRVDVKTDHDPAGNLTLPSDTTQLGQLIAAADVGMLVLDPLLSAIDATVNDYRSREVRAALEPLVAMADRTRCTVLGIAHFTKASGSDPLLLVSGSAGFGQLVRAALGFARDDDTSESVLSQIKNNLGREDLPSLAYAIEPATVDTPDGPSDVSRFVLGDPSDRHVRDMLRDNGNAEDRTERDEAAEWLTDYLAAQGGQASAGDTIKAARGNGIAERTVQRARKRAGIVSVKDGMLGGWVWRIDTGRRHEGAEDANAHMQAPSAPSAPTVATVAERVEP